MKLGTQVLAMMWLAATSGCLSDLLPAGGRQPPTETTDAGELPLDAGADGAILNDGGSPTPDAAPMSDLATPPTKLFIEAESGTLSTPMAEADDVNASGGKYIAVPATGVGGKAVYVVNLPEAGSYALWGRVIGPADANNSFHLSIDTDTIDNDATDGSSTIWDLPIGAAWTWARGDMRTDVGNTALTFNLSAGTHTIYINEREELSQLDRLYLSNDPSRTPPTP